MAIKLFKLCVLQLIFDSLLNTQCFDEEQLNYEEDAHSKMR